MAFSHRVLNIARNLPLPSPNVCTRIAPFDDLEAVPADRHSNMLVVIELTKLDE